MKKKAVLGFVVILSTGFAFNAFASDWDKVGKILTGVEGVRILTGGNVDLIGTITGVNKTNKTYSQKNHHPKKYVYKDTCAKRKWVPHFVWKKKWIPKHKEYDEDFGEIIVLGHYIKYKVRDGGHWEYKHNKRHH